MAPTTRTDLPPRATDAGEYHYTRSSHAIGTSCRGNLASGSLKSGTGCPWSSSKSGILCISHPAGNTYPSTFHAPISRLGPGAVHPSQHPCNTGDGPSTHRIAPSTMTSLGRGCTPIRIHKHDELTQTATILTMCRRFLHPNQAERMTIVVEGIDVPCMDQFELLSMSCQRVARHQQRACSFVAPSNCVGPTRAHCNCPFDQKTWTVDGAKNHDQHPASLMN